MAAPQVDRHSSGPKVRDSSAQPTGLGLVLTSVHPNGARYAAWRNLSAATATLRPLFRLAKRPNQFEKIFAYSLSSLAPIHPP